jgi:hypothetical protein
VITEVFDFLVPPALRIARKGCRAPVPMQVCELSFGGNINASAYRLRQKLQQLNCLHHGLEALNNPVPPPSQDINLVASMMRLFTTLLSPEFCDAEWVSSLSPKLVRSRLEAMLLFSLVWSVGTNTDAAGREHFDQVRFCPLPVPPYR